MKKIIFMVLCLMSFIGVINAVGIELKEQTEVLYTSNTNILEYRGGYLFINTGNGNAGNFGALITYFKDNKKADSKELGDVTLESVAVDNEYIYVYGYKSIHDPSYYNARYFLKLDKDFNIVDEKDARIYQDTYNLRDYIPAYKAIIKDNKFIVLLRKQINNVYVEHVMVVTKDFNIESIEPLSSSSYKNDFPAIQKIKYGDNYITYGEIDSECYTGLADSNPNCDKQIVSLVDKDGKTIWEKDYSNYGYISAVRYNVNHILIATDKGLLIVNQKGDVEAEFNKIKVDGQLFVAGDYLIFTNREKEGKPCPTAMYTGYTECADAVRHSIYKLIYNIKTKILDGQGRIEVIESSEATEGVTFKVIPEDGYVLGEVRVTDVNGKVVIFKDYTFTMPSADVLIEATFVKAKVNPKTADIAIAIVGTIAIIAAITIIIQFRKARLAK